MKEQKTSKFLISYWLGGFNTIERAKNCKDLEELIKNHTNRSNMAIYVNIADIPSHLSEIEIHALIKQIRNDFEKDDINNSIKKEIEKQFQSFSIKISPIDNKTFGIYVYDVSENERRKIIDFICDLQDKLFPEQEIILLPMIKTIEVTREYYPEYHKELNSSTTKN